MSTSLVIDRVLPAPPEQVWTAFTTEEGLAGWWWTHLPNTTYAVDLRVGGEYRIDSPSAGIGVHGAYVAIDAPRSFTASWIWVDDGTDGPAERIALTFAPDPAGTKLTITHDGPWTTSAPADAYRIGWTDTIDALERELVRAG